jgi:hypothetical protein
MLLGGSKEPPFCLFVLHQKCKSSPPEVREQVIRSFNHLFFLLSLSLSLSIWVVVAAFKFYYYNGVVRGAMVVFLQL